MEETSEKPLTKGEIAVLVALWEACNGSIHAHVPEQAVISRFKPHFRGLARKTLRKLARRPERYVLRHKNRETSYSITMMGIRKLRELGIITR